MFLFHGDTLGEIAWSVYVLTLADGDVIGQKLQGDASHEGLEALQRVGQLNHMVGILADQFITLSDKSGDSSASCPHFLNI